MAYRRSLLVTAIALTLASTVLANSNIRNSNEPRLIVNARQSTNECKFDDACKSSKKVRARPGGHISDSCKRTYRVGAGCTLTRVNAAKVRRVQGVYFLERGQSLNRADVTAVKRQMRALQRKWFDEFGSTFALAKPIVKVIRADHNKNYYINTPDGYQADPHWYRLTNMKKEVYRKLGIKDYDAYMRVINYPTTTSNGNVGADLGGAWMDGDDLACITGRAKSFPYDDGVEANCLGHVAHELGHVFGLDHTGPITDCMRFGFYKRYVPIGTCTFSTGNRNIVKSGQGAWLKEIPGAIIG